MKYIKRIKSRSILGKHKNVCSNIIFGWTIFCYFKTNDCNDNIFDFRKHFKFEHSKCSTGLDGQ